MNPILEFRSVSLGYGRTVVVGDVSFALHPGEFFGLVGPNGAGKTTILRAILGTLPPLKGQIVRPSGTSRLCFGYVPQRDTIDDVLPYTVGEVVLMSRYRRIGLFRRPNHEDRAAVDRSLEHVGIADLRESLFRDLSGGQKQRVLIARALAMGPDVLVLDEPTNGMDLSSRTSILALIAQLHRSNHLTILMVSHLLDDVANHAARLAVVDRGVFQVGPVEEILTGTNLSSLYGMPVDVQRVGNRTIILAGTTHEPN
jgi:ABC-type Mn2+/Zn2+ transport system ATPase subunit